VPLCRYGCNQLNLRELDVAKETKGLALGGGRETHRGNVETSERLNVERQERARECGQK
jgi:hypothetical protein